MKITAQNCVKAKYKSPFCQKEEGYLNSNFSQIQNTKEVKPGHFISSNLAIIHFGSNIVPAKRLDKANHVISKYIREIYKARWLHGDKAVIDLSMGNPDLIPPVKAREALVNKVSDLWSHRYNNPKGESGFLSDAAIWVEKRFGIKINYKKEVMVLSGSSDAVDHIFSAYANYGDKVLIPNPGYALYEDIIKRHDLKPVSYELNQKNYLPNFKEIAETVKDAKIMILNYPHNPTGAFAPKHMFDEAVKFLRKRELF